MSEGKIGLLGGTFDPIHKGHLMLAQAAKEKLQLDEAVFIPSFVPPHKKRGPYASFEDRYRMVEKAIADKKDFTVSDIEQKRLGLSYTIDTVKELKNQFKDGKLYFICGSDAYGQFRTWHDWKNIMNYAQVVFSHRPGYNIIEDAILNQAAHETQYGFVHFYPNTPDISSTEIRACFNKDENGIQVRNMLVEEVYHYILEHNLYQGGL